MIGKVRNWAAYLWQPALMLLGLAAAGLLARALGLDSAIAHAGERGPLVFVALGSIVCAAGVPRQVVAYAGGLAFGFWPGSALALLAEVIGCAADFFWARLVARAWAARFLARSEAKGGRLARMERFLTAQTFRATLTIRLLPVGNNLVTNLLAGVSGAAAGPFLVASALGYIPQTAVFTLLGGGIRVSEGTQMAMAAALMVVSVALGVLLLRRRPLPG